MSYILVLDDNRSIPQVMLANIAPWTPELRALPTVLVKDFKEAQQHMVRSQELCSHVCLDWNLYSSPNHMDLTGLDFAQWLTHYDEARKRVLTDDFTFSVHSSDEVAAKQIFEEMQEHQEYMKSKQS